MARKEVINLGPESKEPSLDILTLFSREDFSTDPPPVAQQDIPDMPTTVSNPGTFMRSSPPPSFPFPFSRKVE